METRAQPDKEPGENWQVKRVGMVIEIKPEQIEAYKRLHVGPGVRDLLRQANIHNFSIYLRQLKDGRFYEFAYYEYTGADYEADMAWLATQPANQEWLALCDPMQMPLSGETGWAVMESIYFNE
jgi:L-rhamnose mutarotase